MSEEKSVELEPVLPQKLDEVDRMVLELAKQKRLLALANAEKSLAQNESAEIAYKYVVLQLYMKYGLKEVDALSEDGSIIRGGNKVQQINK